MTMLERVAQAVYLELPITHGEARCVANAVINAMREPTRIMTQAGGAASSDEGGPPWAAGPVWTAMIDAACRTDTARKQPGPEDSNVNKEGAEAG